MVEAAAARDQTCCVRLANQPERLARYAQADLDLGADRHEVHEAPQHVDDVVIELVAAIVADLLAQQAGAHAPFELLSHGL